MTTYHCRQALLPDGVADDVLVETVGVSLAGITTRAQCPAGAVRLHGLVLPGFANAHSHAFHRALRGRAQGGRSFWSWRDQMYAIAARLTPEHYFALARATYAEMVLAGYTCVGEFHYLHHQSDGTPYADPHVMSAALVAAAADAGIRITLLDTCYLAGGFGETLSPVQRRFADSDVDAWAARAGDFTPNGDHARTGAAVHSVRAVPATAIPMVVTAQSGPLHVHVSEQRAENDACRRAHGCSPTRLLADAGVMGERTTVVHGVHLDAADIAMLGGSTVCVCPSTERDLGDGLAPVTDIREAGAPIALGTDSHASIDPFAEMRGLEYGERLRRESRGNVGATELLGAATEAGHRSLGWPDSGALRPGAPADLVAVSLGGVRTAGATGPEAAVFTAAAGDVTDVVVGGRHVVRGGVHTLIDDVPGSVRRSIAAVTG